MVTTTDSRDEPHSLPGHPRESGDPARSAPQLIVIRGLKQIRRLGIPSPTKTFTQMRHGCLTLPSPLAPSKCAHPPRFMRTLTIPVPQ